MTSEIRRGACPDVLHPMETGDGLLARLPPRDGPMPIDTLLGLCAAARAHGNGILEVTRRGSWQVRGLRPGSVGGFAEAVAELGIEGGGPPIQSNPLAGHDPGAILDARPLAAAVRARLAVAPFLQGLGPKVSLVIDGGGALHLDGLDADLRLRADRAGGQVVLHLLVAGDAGSARALGTVAAEHAVEALERLAAEIAKRGPDARARDVLQREGSEAFAASLGDLLAPCPAPPRRPRVEPVGTHTLRDRRCAVGIGLPFGQSDAAALEEWAQAATRAGASALAPAEPHSLLAIGVDPARAAELGDAAQRGGFIVAREDPRRHVSACSGAPACAAAQMPTRSLGAAAARAAAPLLDGSVRIHLSGCAKGCAHPGAAALTLVGAQGACGLVVADSARAEPLAHFESESLAARLERLSRWVVAAREAGEDSAAVLKRFGTGGVAHALGARSAR